MIYNNYDVDQTYTQAYSYIGPWSRRHNGQQYFSEKEIMEDQRLLGRSVETGAEHDLKNEWSTM
jgi:hypothetical protein